MVVTGGLRWDLFYEGIWQLGGRFVEGVPQAILHRWIATPVCPPATCEVKCGACACAACPACTTGAEWWILLFLLYGTVTFWLGSLCVPRRVQAPQPQYQLELDVRSEAEAQLALLRARRNGSE